MYILLGRVNMSQANSLNLFSNREQECEQRAQLLKRLAFVLLCSEKDQFHKHVPEIQGKILKLNIRSIKAQIFYI